MLRLSRVIARGPIEPPMRQRKLVRYLLSLHYLLQAKRVVIKNSGADVLRIRRRSGLSIRLRTRGSVGQTAAGQQGFQCERAPKVESAEILRRANSAVAARKLLQKATFCFRTCANIGSAISVEEAHPQVAAWTCSTFRFPTEYALTSAIISSGSRSPPRLWIGITPLSRSTATTRYNGEDICSSQISRKLAQRNSFSSSRISSRCLSSRHDSIR